MAKAGTVTKPIFIALAVLLKRYRFDCVGETRPWPVQKLTTQPDGGLPMALTRR